jgi:hypothetical protein
MTRPDPDPLPPACTAVRDHWQHLLDDEPALAARFDRAALDAHCAACPDCAGWAAAAQRLREGLAARRPPLPPVGLADRLLAAALRDRRRLVRRRRLAGLALAASLLVAVGTTLALVARGPREVAVREGVARPLASAAAPSLTENLGRAGSALASLTRRAAEEAVEPTVSLLPRPPAPRLGPRDAWPPALGPAVQPLAEVRQGGAVGLEPVAASALRALDVFRRQLPRDPEGRPGL